MYILFVTGRCSRLVRSSVAAYSSAAVLRDEEPVVPPGCIIWQRAAHMSVPMASRVTCGWNVQTFLMGPPMRYISWPNCFGDYPCVRSDGPIRSMAINAPPCRSHRRYVRYKVVHQLLSGPCVRRSRVYMPPFIVYGTYCCKRFDCG